MINITKKFRVALFNDNRNYLERVTITLTDGTVLNLKNEDLMDGLAFDNMVSSDDNFDVGAAIVGKLTLKINNMYDDYEDYIFDEAIVTASVGLDFGDGTSEVVRKGTYYVDETAYNGSTIVLTCLDYMGLLDVQYDGNLTFPATLRQIVQYCCTKCNVTLGTASFPNYDYNVPSAPERLDGVTYRQMVSWAAQIAGCFAHCDTMGRLRLEWYDFDSLMSEDLLDGGEFDEHTPKYATGDSANGGAFHSGGDSIDGGDFNTDTVVHRINSVFDATFSKSDVLITGVQVTSAEYEIQTVDEDQNDTTEKVTHTETRGTDDYVIAISENPFIYDQASTVTVATFLGTRLIGLRFRIATVSHLSNPSIEAGDVALVSDYKGKVYRCIVSSTKFHTTGRQQTASSAQAPTRNKTRRSNGSDADTENLRRIENELRRYKTAYEVGIDDLATQLAAHSGLFLTKVPAEQGSDAGDIWYLHDKAQLADSSRIIKITADAIGFSTDGGTTWNAGITIDGNMVANILRANGVSASWINTGIIADRTNSNYWNMDTGEFRLGDPASANSDIVLETDLDDFVVDCVVEFCRTSTNTAPSATASGWGPTVTWAKGYYLWSHTKTTYKDGTVTRTGAELVAGPDGLGVSSVDTMWIQTTSNSTVPATNNGSWSTTQPSWVYGRYIWTMTKTTFSDGSVEYSTPVLANALNEDAETVFNKLTNNGETQGIYRALDSNTNKYKLYINATYMKTGILASNDSNQNFKLDLSTGKMDMKKGSINLGYNSNSNTYNFTVNDSGQVGIKSGSIDLGDDSTYGFHVSTAGRLNWKSVNSSMTNTGVLTATGATLNSATINGGSMSVETGSYKTQLKDGYLYCYYGSSYIGKVGTSLFTNDKGMMFDIGYNAQVGGFAVQSGSASNAAALALYYQRSDDTFYCAKKFVANGALQTNGRLRTDELSSITGGSNAPIDVYAPLTLHYALDAGTIYATDYRVVNGNTFTTGKTQQFGVLGLDGNTYDFYFDHGILTDILRR